MQYHLVKILLKYYTEIAKAGFLRAAIAHKTLQTSQRFALLYYTNSNLKPKQLTMFQAQHKFI